jgi:CRISPR-associated protein Cmr4
MGASVATNELKTERRCYFITLDPVHIGTGDYRLGRVDNTIVREPGSNLPKIPGTSLCGAARNYAAVHYGVPEAAGRHQKLDRENEKGKLIVGAFGTATDTGGGQAGAVSISDARILFFPAYSLDGPVWVSTYQIMKESGFQVSSEALLPDEAAVSEKPGKSHVYLGWLVLKAKSQSEIKPPTVLSSIEAWEAIKDRIVIVGDKLFSQIVNSNLEVRTSVAISPITGAAEKGALFTYEAIPRATWLWTELIDRKNHRRASMEQDSPLEVVLMGLEMIEYFGVGGMVTRGFGRMRLLRERGANDGD